MVVLVDPIDEPYVRVARETDTPAERLSRRVVVDLGLEVGR